MSTEKSLSEQWDTLQHITVSRDWMGLWEFCRASDIPVESMWNYSRDAALSVCVADLCDFHWSWKLLARKHNPSSSSRHGQLWNMINDYALAQNVLKLEHHHETAQPTQFFFWAFDFRADLGGLKSSYSPQRLNLNWILHQDELYEKCVAIFYMDHKPYYVEWPSEKGMLQMGKPVGTPPFLYFRAPLKIEFFDPMLFEDLLWGLQVHPDEIDWVSDHAPLIPCQVMRQDDHGNEFEMVQFDSHLEGRWYVAEMERAVHKQTYWVQAR